MSTPLSTVEDTEGRQQRHGLGCGELRVIELHPKAGGEQSSSTGATAGHTGASAP